jgi:hypothetical protein
MKLLTFLDTYPTDCFIPEISVKSMLMPSYLLSGHPFSVFCDITFIKVYIQSELIIVTFKKLRLLVETQMKAGNKGKTKYIEVGCQQSMMTNAHITVSY